MGGKEEGAGERENVMEGSCGAGRRGVTLFVLAPGATFSC